jgi:hypothetical protein
MWKNLQDLYKPNTAITMEEELEMPPWEKWRK